MKSEQTLRDVPKPHINNIIIILFLLSISCRSLSITCQRNIPFPVGPSSAIKTDCQSLKFAWVSDRPALGNSVFQIYCGADYPVTIL